MYMSDIEKSVNDSNSESETLNEVHSVPLDVPQEGKSKRKYTRTEKSEQAFKRCQEARKKQIEQIRLKKDMEKHGQSFEGKIYKNPKKNIKVSFNDDEGDSTDSECEYVIKRVSTKRRNAITPTDVEQIRQAVPPSKSKSKNWRENESDGDDEVIEKKPDKKKIEMTKEEKEHQNLPHLRESFSAGHLKFV